MKLFNKLSSKGFTLIELLIVIAVLGVLAAGVLVAVDPVDKINAANDSKVQTDISTIANASAAFAVAHNNFYAVGPYATAMTTLVSQGELKVSIAAPTGYAYTYTAATDTGAFDDTCISGQLASPSCARVVITSTLKAKKFTGTPFQRYESSTGKTCQVATATTACP